MAEQEHMPHSHQRANRFDSFAEWSARLASGPRFFLVCALVIVVWLPTLFLMNVETSQFIIQTLTAIVTFLLVALLQNSHKRSDEAVHRKLNAVAQAIADLMRERTGDDKDLRDNIERLTETVGLEDRVTTRREGDESKLERRGKERRGQYEEEDEAQRSAS